ncbi:MAG: hypothetical protein U1F57_02430 [bacterium]
MKKYLFLLLFPFLFACGGRVPDPKTAQNIIKDHLNDYGKKYPASVFGGHKVAKVDIVQIEEIQRYLATGIANVALDDGSQFKVQMDFLYKPPLGWRQQGWENLDATPISVPQSSKP